MNVRMCWFEAYGIRRRIWVLKHRDTHINYVINTTPRKLSGDWTTIIRYMSLEPRLQSNVGVISRSCAFLGVPVLW